VKWGRGGGKEKDRVIAEIAVIGRSENQKLPADEQGFGADERGFRGPEKARFGPVCCDCYLVG
jgi:hypothetical protein